MRKGLVALVMVAATAALAPPAAALHTCDSAVGVAWPGWLWVSTMARGESQYYTILPDGLISSSATMIVAPAFGFVSVDVFTDATCTTPIAGACVSVATSAHACTVPMGGVLRVTEVPSAFTGITYAVGIVFDTAV